MSAIFSPEDLERWGWRIPFLMGIAIAFVGFYIRDHTTESPEYEKTKSEGKLSKTPVRETFRDHYRELIRGVCIYMSVTVPFYILTIFITGYLSKILGHTQRDSLLIGTISMAFLMVLVVPTASLTDKWGRKRVMMAATVAYFIFAYPMFSLMAQPGFFAPLTAELVMVFIASFYLGAAPTVFVELFPTSIRYTGMSISYNICAALFGGTAPSVCFWLIDKTGMKSVVAFYIMLSAVLSFIAFIGYRDRYKEEL
jgi:MHS family proline/betaine transporter-like MFS transporter